MSVIAAFKLHDVLTFGVSAGQANCGHRSLGPRVDKTNLLHVGESRKHDFGEIGLGRCGSAETGAVSRGLSDRFDHRGGGVSQDQWAPGADIINVVVAVGVPDVRTLPPNNEGRIAAHCTKCAYGRIDAAWNHLLGTPLEPARLVKLAGHGSSAKRKQSYQRRKPERCCDHRDCEREHRPTSATWHVGRRRPYLPESRIHRKFISQQ